MTSIRTTKVAVYIEAPRGMTSVREVRDLLLLTVSERAQDGSGDLETSAEAWLSEQGATALRDYLNGWLAARAAVHVRSEQAA